MQSFYKAFCLTQSYSEAFYKIELKELEIVQQRLRVI